MVTHTGDIDVLSSVSRLGVRQVSPWGYQRLLSFVRGRYDVVIADLPEVVNNATEVIARAAQAVFVVTTPSSPSLYLAARRRYDLEARGVSASKVKYIVNRKTFDRAIPREAGWAIDAEKIAAIPVDASLVDASEFVVDLADPRRSPSIPRSPNSAAADRCYRSGPAFAGSGWKVGCAARRARPNSTRQRRAEVARTAKGRPREQPMAFMLG